MKFKGIVENSTVREIGSLFRRNDDSNWKINVRFIPKQDKKYINVSQIHLLARRRVLNPTEKIKSAGYKSTITIENTNDLEVQYIDSCPIPSVSSQGDGKQLCFVIDCDGIKYFLPQLELARALFFFNAYFARLSLISNGLLQDFDVTSQEFPDTGYVNILPTCTLPASARWDNTSLQLLAWMLFDVKARKSFDSIANYQFQNGYVSGAYRFWDFQFDAPNLDGVSLVVHGHFDKELQTYFVYEINSVLNLKCNHPSEIVFNDPKFAVRFSGGRGTATNSFSSDFEIELDEDQVPNTDLSPMQIETPPVKFQFTNPANIKRVGKGKSGSVINVDESAGGASNTQSNAEVSTNESSVLGTISPADYLGVEDVGANNIFTGNIFDDFNVMVERLKQMDGINYLYYKALILPGIKGYKKYRLVDGSSRKMLIHYLQVNGELYALFEVDTSDNLGTLSTLLLKPLSGLKSSEWNRELLDIEIALLKHSLVWPTQFLNRKYRERYRRVKHPRMSSQCDPNYRELVINHWAGRVYAAVCSI